MLKLSRFRRTATTAPHVDIPTPLEHIIENPNFSGHLSDYDREVMRRIVVKAQHDALANAKLITLS